MDALYEKVRYDGHVISMVVQLVCGVNEAGTREVLAIEPMLEESRESYSQLFTKLRERHFRCPCRLGRAIRESFPGASWQRCKVHFMRNILAKIPHRNKESLAVELKQIWLAPDAADARKRADELVDKYEKRFPEALQILENGLEDSL